MQLIEKNVDHILL